MPPWLAKILGNIYGWIPVWLRPFAKRGFEGTLLWSQALVSRRRLHRGLRVEFLDFEIANLESYKFLGPGRDEVMVESDCSLVSPGTERAVLCGLPGARRSFPYVPGYSTAGRVVAVGSGVTRFRVGDLVAGRLHHASIETIAADKMFKVSDETSPEEASFIELGIITLQGMRKAGIKPGDRVAVLGQGLIGQLANRLSRLLGASWITAVATSRSRERVAMAPGGADEFVATSGATEPLRDLRADVVIEAVGTPQAVTDAMVCARDGGRVVLLGSSRGLGRDVDLWTLAQTRGLTIVGAHISAMPTQDASAGRWTYEQEGELFFDLLSSGRLAVRDLVTWEARPEECNAVYEALAAGGRGHVGIMFQWKDGAAAPASASV